MSRGVVPIETADPTFSPRLL
uniref:Uncharacterized protein n=1 Tax=Anguilla anguilla TaxID=7936 RepID=A0A0E9SKG7_ANGAN